MKEADVLNLVIQVSREPQRPMGWVSVPTTAYNSLREENERINKAQAHKAEELTQLRSKLNHVQEALGYLLATDAVRLSSSSKEDITAWHKMITQALQR